jgi:hypothetical protein
MRSFLIYIPKQSFRTICSDDGSIYHRWECIQVLVEKSERKNHLKDFGAEGQSG